MLLDHRKKFGKTEPGKTNKSVIEHEDYRNSVDSLEQSKKIVAKKRMVHKNVGPGNLVETKTRWETDQ